MVHALLASVKLRDASETPIRAKVLAELPAWNAGSASFCSHLTAAIPSLWKDVGELLMFDFLPSCSVKGF